MRKSSDQFAAGDGATQDQDTTSEDDYGAQPTPPEDNTPRIVCPIIFQGRTPPPRRWVAPQWIPYEVVTGFYGDGGVGKSLMAQQLQTGTALGSAWLGVPVEESGASAFIARTARANSGAGNATSTSTMASTTMRSPRCIGCRASAKTTS
jgi:hypothetical protein